MSYLTLDADRLVRDAVDAFLEGRLRPDPLPDTMYATKNSRYRVLAGLVHEASDTSLMGAELVGWLIEDGAAARIEPKWEFRARAIFVERKTRQVVVTSKVVARSAVGPAPLQRATPAPGGMQKPGSIPPAPQVPRLKNGPSVAPPALVSLGPQDPKPRPMLASDDEITKVEFTSVADAHEIAELLEISAHGADPPASHVIKKPAPAPAEEDAEEIELSGPDIEVHEPPPVSVRIALPPINPPPKRR
jgi:hypothetical protein